MSIHVSVVDIPISGTFAFRTASDVDLAGAYPCRRTCIYTCLCTRVYTSCLCTCLYTCLCTHLHTCLQPTSIVDRCQSLCPCLLTILRHADAHLRTPAYAAHISAHPHVQPVRPTSARLQLDRQLSSSAAGAVKDFYRKLL